MSGYLFNAGKPPVSLMEAGPVVEIHASLQANQQLSHKDYGRDGFPGPTILPRQAMYTPPEYQFVLQDHNYWAPYPSTPPPRSPKRERLYNDHSYDEDWTKALINSNALPGGRKPNPIPPPRESSRGRGSARGSSRGRRGGSTSEGRKLPPLPNMKNSGTTKLVPSGKSVYTRPTPPKVDLPSPRLPSPDMLSQSEIFARYKTPTPEPPIQNGAFKDIQRLWERKSSAGPAMLPDPPSAMSNDDDNSSRTSSAPERDGDDTETAPEAENYSDAVTRCVCNFDHDDGYMICCDRCSVWQHVDCMGIGRNSIPEEYLCELCSPRRIDRVRARTLQQRKRIEFRLNSSASSSSESGDESDGEMPKRKRSISKSVKGPPRKNSKQRDRVKRPQMKKQVKKKADSKRPTLDVGRITNMRQRRKSQPSKAPEDLPASEAIGSDSDREKDVPEVVSSLSDDGLSSPREEAGKLPLASWIERYEEAVTNHYSPELRARVATMRNTGQQQDFKGLPPAISQKCRVVLMTFNKKGLVCNVPVSANQALVEFRGKMMLSSQYQHKPQPKVGRATGTPYIPYVRFYPVARDLEICVDSRTYGNDARYVQQSCLPNSEIRHVIEKGLLHLYVVSLRSLDKNEEVTIIHDPKNPLACSDHRCRYHTAKEPLTNNNTEMAVERAARARRRRRQTATTDEEFETSPAAAAPPPRHRKDSEVPQRKEPEFRQRKDSEVLRRSDTDLSHQKEPETPSVKSLPPKTSPPAPPPGAAPTKRKRKVTEFDSGDESDQEKRKRRDTDSDHGEGRKRTRSEVDQGSGSDKKLSREDRKMEAIMKAFERMEKLQARSTPRPPVTQTPRAQKSESKGSDSNSPVAKPSRRGGRRGGRQRRLSGKKRFVSGSDMTSQDENEEDEDKSPRDQVEFKFPSSKKDDHDIISPDVSSGSAAPSVPSQYMRAIKSPSRGANQSKRPSFSSILSIAPTQEGGSAKKRWLRQAISEETEDHANIPVTPGASGGSTPVTETAGADPFDHLTPLKKRRVARSVTVTPTPSSPMSPEPSVLQVPLPNGNELSPASKTLAFLDVMEGVDMKRVENVKKEIRFEIEEPKDVMPETFLEKDETKETAIEVETEVGKEEGETENVEKKEEKEEVIVENIVSDLGTTVELSPDVEKTKVVVVEKEDKDSYDKAEDVDIEGVELNEEEKQEIDIEGDCDSTILGRVRLEKALTDENVDVENDLEETDGKAPTTQSCCEKPVEEPVDNVASSMDVIMECESAAEVVEPVPKDKTKLAVKMPVDVKKLDSVVALDVQELGNAVALKPVDVGEPGNAVALKPIDVELLGNAVALKPVDVGEPDNAVALKPVDVELLGNAVALKPTDVKLLGDAVALKLIDVKELGNAVALEPSDSDVEMVDTVEACNEHKDFENATACDEPVEDVSTILQQNGKNKLEGEKGSDVLVQSNVSSDEKMGVVEAEVACVEVRSPCDNVNSAKDVPDSGIEMSMEPPLLAREVSMSPISDDGTPPSSPAPLSEPRTPLQDEVDDPLSPKRSLGISRLPPMDFTLPPSPPPPDYSFMKNVQEWEDSYLKKDGDTFETTPEPPALDREVMLSEEQKPKKKLSISEYRRRKCTSTSEERTTPTPDEFPPVLTLPTPPGELSADDMRPITPSVIAEAAGLDLAGENPSTESQSDEASPRTTRKDPFSERTKRGFFLRVRDPAPQQSSSKTSSKGPAPLPVPKGKWFTSTPRTPLIAPPPKAPVFSVLPGAKISFPFPVRFSSPSAGAEGSNGGPRAFHSPVTPMKLLKFPSLRPQNGLDSHKSGSKDKSTKGGKSS